MSINFIEDKIKELKEIESFVSELNEQAEEIRDQIKKEMTDRGVSELEVGQYIVRYTSVLSTRFDMKRFKEVFGDEIYKAYTKDVSSHRFQIA